MPKSKKRKTPIAGTSYAIPSTNAQDCRKTIRQFHVLLKRSSQLENLQDPSPVQVQESGDIEKELARLGGVEKYQQMSLNGQKEERGGGSEKIFITWMKQLGLHHIHGGSNRLRLLDVGALEPDNYKSCISWIDCTPMDLHARHPNIMEQDFLTMETKDHAEKWNVISLSLVVNFVSSPADRGRMLRMAHSFLISGGYLFLALPLPCVTNSRFLNLEHLKALMESLGFSQIREKWRPNGKMAYWLYQKCTAPSISSSSFGKKSVLRQGNRNNFAIILT